jgi:hypothetical protein
MAKPNSLNHAHRTWFYTAILPIGNFFKSCREFSPSGVFYSQMLQANRMLIDILSPLSGMLFLKGDKKRDIQSSQFQNSTRAALGAQERKAVRRRGRRIPKAVCARLSAVAHAVPPPQPFGRQALLVRIRTGAVGTYRPGYARSRPGTASHP